MTYFNRFNQVALAAVTFGALSVSAFAAQTPNAQATNIQVASAASDTAPVAQQAVPVWVGQPPHIVAWIKAPNQNSSVNYQKVDQHTSAGQAVPNTLNGWQH